MAVVSTTERRRQAGAIPRVLALGFAAAPLDEQILVGINRFRLHHQLPWLLERSPPHADPAEWLGNRYLGAIIRIGTNRPDPCLAQWGRPVVGVGAEAPSLDASVRVDEQRIGEVAANHLLACGLQHGYFFAPGGGPGLASRWAAFAATLGNAGGQARHLVSDDPAGDSQAGVVDTSWIDLFGTVVRPAGVLARDDLLGSLLIDLVANSHLAVPDDLAILSVGDHTSLCEACPVPLSSIALPGEALGTQAAELMAVLLGGGLPLPPHRHLEPGAISTRASTAGHSEGDPLVARAQAWIRAHADHDIGVGDIAAQVGVDRRTLSRRFQRQLERSPLAEVHRVRLARAQALLRDSDESITTIARRSGFGDQATLVRHFRDKLDTTPSAWRARARQGG